MFMEAAVRRGIALLDERMPGWELKGRPHMNSKQWCVLGQLFGHYDAGLRELDLPRIQAPFYGFDLPFDAHLPYLPYRGAEYGGLVFKLVQDWAALADTWETLAKEDRPTKVTPLPLPELVLIDEAVLVDERELVLA